MTGNGFVDDFRDFVLEHKNFASRQQLDDRLRRSDGEVGARDDHCAIVAIVIEYRDAHSGSDPAEHGDVCPVHLRAIETR